MKILEGEELKEAERFMEEAAKAARKATCKRANCGTVIVSDSEVIGVGFNSPPNNDEESRMCEDQDYDWMKKKKYDKTCCMHAEWRAVLDGLARNAGKMKGSRLYFVRVDDEGNLEKKADEPYCTVCSRLALDSGVTEFVLWRTDGIAVYPTDEYNRISYDFHKNE